MNTRFYWVIQHLRRTMHESRLIWRCWWLTQRVKFLEWRLRCDVLMAKP
jgi:hypothetical protein